MKTQICAGLLVVGIGALAPGTGAAADANGAKIIVRRPAGAACPAT